jgi:hypothetical protein
MKIKILRARHAASAMRASATRSSLVESLVMINVAWTLEHAQEETPGPEQGPTALQDYLSGGSALGRQAYGLRFAVDHVTP